MELLYDIDTSEGPALVIVFPASAAVVQSWVISKSGFGGKMYASRDGWVNERVVEPFATAEKKLKDPAHLAVVVPTPIVINLDAGVPLTLELQTSSMGIQKRELFLKPFHPEWDTSLETVPAGAIADDPAPSTEPIAEDPTPIPEPVPIPSPVPWYRRTRVILASAGACSVIAILGISTWFSSGETQYANRGVSSSDVQTAPENGGSVLPLRPESEQEVVPIAPLPDTVVPVEPEAKVTTPAEPEPEPTAPVVPAQISPVRVSNDVACERQEYPSVPQPDGSNPIISCHRLSTEISATERSEVISGFGGGVLVPENFVDLGFQNCVGSYGPNNSFVEVEVLDYRTDSFRLVDPIPWRNDPISFSIICLYQNSTERGLRRFVWQPQYHAEPRSFGALSVALSSVESSINVFVYRADGQYYPVFAPRGAQPVGFDQPGNEIIALVQRNYGADNTILFENGLTLLINEDGTLSVLEVPYPPSDYALREGDILRDGSSTDNYPYSPDIFLDYLRTRLHDRVIPIRLNRRSTEYEMDIPTLNFRH